MRMIDLALPYQREFILSPKRRKIWLSSRQVGKSWALAYIGVEKALTRPGGGLSLLVSTGARAAGELLRKCVQMAEAAKILSDGEVGYTSSADTVTFGNGGRVISLPSGNPTALRGWSASAILIDEAAFIERPDDVFAAIAPTLTRDPESELIVASTPAGRSGVFYDLYTGADSSWHVQRTTIHDAVRDGLKVDVDQLRQLCPDPDVFAQEYECTFASQYGTLIDTGLIDWYDVLPEEGRRQTYLGMDVGATSDRTALVTIDRIGDVDYVDDIVVMHRASYEQQMEMVRELHGRNAYSGGYVDANGIGSALAEFISKDVSSRIRGFTWTASNKTPAYEDLRAGIFDHKIKFNRKFKNLVEEDFSNVSRIVSESGKVSYEAGRSRNGHSDVTSAVVLALQASKKTPARGDALPEPFFRSSSFGQWTSRL